MKVVTVRLDPEFLEELDAEYEERGFRNRTVYIRRILEERDVIFEGGSDVEQRVAEHADRLERLDARVDDLTARSHSHSWDPEADSSP